MAMRTKPRAPQTLAVMENAHFSDSASSHNGASDDESHLQYTATGLGGDALAKQGSGKRRRSGGLPSLISKSGSRSNLGIDAGITRAHEIRSQAAAAEKGGFAAHLHPGTSEASLRMSGSGRVGSSATRSAQELMGQDAVAIATLESSSSEGDMTWEDFLASTDESGDTASAATATVASATSLGTRRPKQPPLLPGTLPPAGMRVVANTNGGSALERRPPPPAQPPHPSTSMSREAPLPSHNGLATVKVKETAGGFSTGLMSWGKSKAVNIESDDSAPESAGSDHGGGVGGMKQELTWGQYVIQNKVEPSPRSNGNWRVPTDPPRKISAEIDVSDDDDDDDIDDIMSTFGPVSIRPDQDDILFARKEEEILLIIDRNDGDTAKSNGNGISSVSAVGKADGGGGGPQDTFGSGPRDNVGQGNGGSFPWLGGGTRGHDGGGRISTGFRGRVENGKSSPTRSPPSAKQSLGHKKPSFPPPSYGSVGRPRESPLLPSPPPPQPPSTTSFVGATVGNRQGLGRAPNRGGRRSEDLAAIGWEGPSGRQGSAVDGRDLQPRTKGTSEPQAGLGVNPLGVMPRSHPAADATRPLDGGHWQLRNGSRRRASTEADDAQRQNRLGVPLAELRRPNSSRKDSLHPQGAAQSYNHNHVVGAGFQGMGCTSGGGAGGAASEADPVSPPPYSAGNQRPSKDRSKGSLKRSTDNGRSGGGSSSRGVGGVSLAGGGGGVQSQKLTASALQRLQPEGVPGSFWGQIQRSRNRDTLHHLIEGHAQRGAVTFDNSPPHDTPARERSLTEDSQVRPRPRTSSGGPTTAEAPPSTGGNESSGVGNTNAGTSGGGGGGGLSFGLRLNIGTNTASALRSAISLRRNDTSTSTSDSVGSRVMRTLSTMSSGVRSTAEMSNAIQQAAAAATGGVGGGAGRGQEDLPSVTTEQQQLASSHQDVVATQLPSSTNAPPENRSLSVDMLYAHGGIIPRRWIGRNMNPQASQQQVGTGGRETALSKGRPLSHDFTSQGQALRPVHSAVVAAENLRKQEEERQRATGKNSETAVMAVAEERNRRIRSQTRAQVERLKAEKLLETTPLHERALLGRNPAMIEPFGGQPQAGNRRRRPSTGATGEIETTEHRMRLFVARAGEEKKRAAVEADLARAAVAAAAEEAAAAAEAEAAMVSAAREQSMRARKVSAFREVEVEIKKSRAELEVALKARERRETADLIAEREWNEKRERAERSRDRFERERLDREQLNQDRLERERLERERARLEQERLEQGRLERERLEQERLEQERMEKERLEQERLEKERLEQERLEKERLEQGRLERERLEKEQLEQERLERERLEQERLEKERLEQGRLEQERLEKERLEHERLDRERFELERLGREQSNRERLEKERMEKDRLTKERSEKERVDKVIPEDMLSSFLKSKEPALANLEVTAIARGTGQAGFFAQTPERIAPAFSADPSAEARLNAGTTDSIDDGRGESEEAGGLLPTLPKESPAPIMNQGSSKTCSVVANGVVAMTPGSNVHSPEKAIAAATVQEGQSGAETVTVVEEDPSPPAPLTQQERDENIMRAHLASWRFCFHEAAALLTPVLGSSYVEAPNGAGGAVDPVAHSAMPTGNAFFAGPQEETDLHSELWAKLVQAEALMLQTLLSVSSGATKDTLEACEAVHETLESCLPPNKSAMWDDIAFKLAGAAEVVQARIDESSPASPEALEAVSVPPTLTEQAILLELEVLMVTVAMQLMVGQVIKAAKTTHKFIKISHWLLKAKDVDAKAAKRARNKATAPPTSGVTMIQNFFFNKKSAPAPAPTSTSVRPAATAVSRRGEGKINGGGGKLVDLRSPPSLPPSLPPRMRIANGNGSGSGSGSSSGSGSGSQDSSDDMYLFLEEAVPREFAGRSWEGYLHHVDFLVALMHVGTSLIPKSLMKLIERFMSYTPSFEKGLSLLSECCRTKGMRRPCAAAVLELLMFRELKREAKLMKAGKASKATTTGARTSQKEEPTNGKRGFRRRIQFRQAGDGGGGSSLSRAAALDEAQVALDLFYSSFPVVPLLSVAHAKALQTSGNFEEAYELCLMAQKVVEQSVEKGGGMGPAHDPHVLWLQLGLSSFFLQRWTQALDVFTRIMQGVAQVCEKDQRGLTGFSAAYAAASMCGVQPVVQEEVHKLLEVACAAIKKQEAAGAKEHRGLRDRLEGYASRGPPGAELWLFELLYLHNASAANSMPEAWHESMLELLGETPVAAMSMAFPQEGVKYNRSQTDAIMAHKFTEGLVLYKLERMEESLDTFRWIVDCARDKDEPQGMISDIGIPKVVLTESRFVLPHALYLTAHLSYRLRPVEDQLYLSHDLCARAKKIKDYDFDCQVKIGNLMASLRNYMDAIESAAR